MKEQIENTQVRETRIREVVVNYRTPSYPRLAMNAPEYVATFVRGLLSDNSREHAIALYLDVANHIVCYATISIGNATTTAMSPREIYQRAVLVGAVSIILAHNHPSGELAPSEADINVTTQLCKAGKVLGIDVLDHVIVGDAGFYSFSNGGEMLRCNRS